MMIIPNKKICQYCEKEKPAREFERFSKSPDGLYRRCKSCKDLPSKKFHGPCREGHKMCMGCGRDLPLNSDCFIRSKRSSDGFVSKCKECDTGRPIVIDGHKCCPSCSRELGLEHFQIWGTKNSTSSICYECKNGLPLPKKGHKHCSKCRRELPFSDFHSHPGASGLTSRCAKCLNIGRIQSIYRIEYEEYLKMLKSQSFRCANKGCSVNFELDNITPHVDHDHSCCPGNQSCGKCVRGLLCSGCNTAIGLMEESIDKLSGAIAYLKMRR